jgi:multimeric flavodoxin WrbA
MKVVAISGSPRKNGNTEQAIEITFGPLQAAGIETEMVSLAGLTIGPCIACGACREKGQCLVHKDDFVPISEKVKVAEGLILASPVYFGCATGPICNFMHRLGYVARQGDNYLSRKVGGAIAVARRAGQNSTFSQLSMFYAINDMIQVGSIYWNVLVGREVGDIQADKEGVATMKRFGENLAWALQKLHG